MNYRSNRISFDFFGLLAWLILRVLLALFWLKLRLWGSPSPSIFHLGPSYHAFFYSAENKTTCWVYHSFWTLEWSHLWQRPPVSTGGKEMQTTHCSLSFLGSRRIVCCRIKKLSTDNSSETLTHGLWNLDSGHLTVMNITDTVSPAEWNLSHKAQGELCEDKIYQN